MPTLPKLNNRTLSDWLTWIETLHPRTIELPADRRDHSFEIVVDRETGLILRLIETIGGSVTRDAVVTDIAADATLPPSAFDFVFPTGTTMLY